MCARVYACRACACQVRLILIERASSARLDPPLLAACAHDITAHCADFYGNATSSGADGGAAGGVQLSGSNVLR
jgi:hypothetical protein